jgi:hypothetical protein
MTGRALGRLLGQNLRRGKRAFALSVFGIAVGISSLTFFLALSAGVDQVVRKVFPTGQLEVVPASSSLDSGPLGVLGALGGPKPLTDEAADRLAARPEVARAWRRMRLAFAARAFGGHEILGRDIHAELIAEGVDPGAVDESVAPEPFSDALGSQSACVVDADCAAPEYCPSDTRRCERPVPAVISPFLVEMYNGAIAPSHGLPRLGGFLASRLRGFTFGTELGQSFFGVSRPSRTPPRERRIMLVGVARRAARLALTLPLGFVRAWNTAYAGEAAGHELSSVLLELKPGADVARLSAAIRELGYTVADSGAERVGLALTLLTLLFLLVSIAVVAVAAINIAHSFFRAVAERRREIGVMRAVGASAADVQKLFLVEAATIGLCGAGVGLAFARLAALVVDWAAARFLPDFPFRPETYFSFDWRIVAGSVLCSVIACMAGAWWPARAAARLDPTEALASP